MKFIVYHESASYWDIGERVSEPPKWAANEMQPTEQCIRPVARVPKSQGRKNLALLLAAPETLLACKRICEAMFQIAGGSLELAAMYGPDFVPPNEKDIEREYYRCCEAIKQAEGVG